MGGPQQLDGQPPFQPQPPKKRGVGKIVGFGCLGLVGVTAQLQGSGDINCSVTVEGHSKKGHASGGYNLCTAQLSSGLLGGWD